MGLGERKNGEGERRSWVVTCLNVARVVPLRCADARGLASLSTNDKREKRALENSTHYYGTGPLVF